MSKFCVLIAAFAASVWGQSPSSCNPTGATIVRPCLNNTASREFGQPALLQFLNSTAPNLVEGREMNQPFAVAFDTTVTPPIMYVVDEANSRVLAYQNPANLNACGVNNLTCGIATQVIGPRPNDFTTTFPGGPNPTSPAVTAGFNAPTSAAVDSNGNLYVLDAGNNRILRFPSPLKQTMALWQYDLVIGQKSVASGTSANQGQISSPSATSLFFSNGGTLYSASLTIEPATGALWVTDPGNNRVLRFPTSQLAANTTLPQADLVIGQSNFTSQQVPTPPPNTLNQLVYTSLYQPAGITFDAKDRLYVSDGVGGQFYRVLFFNGGYATGMAASRILGLVFQLPSPAPTVTFPNQYQLLGPVGLAAYPGNNLWVADVGNSRVVEYDVPENWPALPTSTPGQAPTTGQVSPPMLPAGVIGQPTLTTPCPSNGCQNKGQPKPDNTTLATPAGLAFNGTDLWIADTGNNRVLDFPQQSGGTYSTASHLAGQVDFPYNSPNLIEGREVYFPGTASIAGLPFAGGGIAIDRNSTPPHMYVADTANNRVLCFNNAYSNPSRADLVLGQTDLYSSLTNSPLNVTSTMTQSGLNLPTDVVVDANGNLWVADAGNGRVLRFPAPFSQPTGTQILPTVVLGQIGFTGTPITNASIETMDVPYGLAIFSDGSLAVSDAALHRVLIFKNAAGSDFQNSQSASIVLGQTSFQSSTQSNSAAGLYSPRHMSVDTSDRLYVADAGNNRLVVFNGANNLGNGSASSLQVSFSAPQAVKVSPLTGFIWVSSTNSDQLYLLPEYDTLIIEQTQNGFPYYAQIATQTPVIAIELDSGDSMITSELSNRVTFYYPAIAWQNVGNYNSRPLAPGQLALLYQYGAGYSFTPTGALPPLPPMLGDVQIMVNGTAAPIYELDPDAIAFQVPSSAPTSETSSFVVLHPSTGQIIGTGNVPMAQFNPGFFATGSGGVPGIGLLAAVNSTGGINGPSNPIKANGTNFIEFYLTGGGSFPGILDGQVGTTTVMTIVQPQILSVDGWAGLAPASQIAYSGSSFFPGVWQINYYVSNLYGPGIHVIAVTMNGISSNIGPSGTIQVYFVSN
jgi:uncharacterized protein (TIGR03437 family)